MRSVYLCVAVFFLGLIGRPLAAAGLPVVVTLSGSAAEGSPAFQVKVDGKVIGSGEVSNLNAVGQSFAFSAPAGSDPVTVSIEFTNDRMIKSQSTDRNLYVLSVKVGERSFDGSEMEPIASAKSPGRKSGSVFRLYANGEVFLSRPQEGWVNQAEPVVAATPPCPDDLIVSGFAIASSALPSGANKLMSTFLADAKDGECRIAVVGSASTDGPADVNLALARERALAVVTVLTAAGIESSRITVEGVLANQSGPTGRRVILSAHR